MRDGDKIVSMIPAAGYLGESNDGDEATYNPVAAWVVIEDVQGRHRVDGIDPSGGGGMVRPAATETTLWRSCTARSGNAVVDLWINAGHGRVDAPRRF